MSAPSPRAKGARISRLTKPLYAYSFFEEFILLYPLYALLFTDTGLSVTQISSLFVLWSLTSMALAVPTGALADVVPRRFLLAAAPMLSGTGFALWLTFPSYWIFAAGFVLWGAGGALASGAREALVYNELAHRAARVRYPQVMGVARTLGVVAAGGATLLAVPVVSVGGYPAIGIASVAACAVAVVAALLLPESRGTATSVAADHNDPAPDGPAPDDPAADTSATYLAAMRDGLTEVRRVPAVRGAVLFVVVVGSFWGILEEYVPLLASSAGVATEHVPLVVLAVWTCIAVGGLLAGRAARLTPRAVGGLLVVAAVIMSAGAMLGTVLGWLLLGIGFGICQLASIVADARLQDRIVGRSRATVTSLAELGHDGLGVASYLLYAGIFAVAGHGWAFVIFALPYLIAGLIVGRTKPASPEYISRYS